MNESAFVFTIEAVLALLAVAAIAGFPVQTEKTDLFELLLLQKENDLLKIWLSESELKESELVSDFNFVFPLLNGHIEIDGKKTEINNSEAKTQNSVSSGALFYSKEGRLAELRIAVYN